MIIIEDVFLQILALIITCSLIYINVKKVTYDDDENSYNFGNYNKPLAILLTIITFLIGSVIIFIINFDEFYEWNPMEYGDYCDPPEYSEESGGVSESKNGMNGDEYAKWLVKLYETRKIEKNRRATIYSLNNLFKKNMGDTKLVE